MPRFISFSCVLLAILLMFSLCPDITYAGESGDADASEPADADEPSVEPEDGEDEEEEEGPPTLESLNEKYKALKEQLKDKGAQAPDSEKLSLTGSVRVRHERRENATDFSSSFDDRVDATLLRSRLGIDANVTDMVGCFVEVEDSRAYGQALDPIYSVSHEADALDLWQGYVCLNLFTHEEGGEDSGVFIGRQEMKFGDQRMVGNYEWGNYGRAFDAARLRWKNKKHDINAWYATMDETARRSKDIEFAGVYYSCTAVEDQEFDAYFMHRRDGDRTTETELSETVNAIFGPVVAPYYGNLIIETIGARADGKLPAGQISFPYNGEFIWQWGHWGPDRMKAWAVALEAGLAIDTQWEPSFFVVYNRASGDSDPFDRIHETPQTPYPTNHEHFGLMDFFSWRNMRQVGVKARVTPLKDEEKKQEMYFEAGYYTFHLDESLDAWYDANGNVISEVFPDVPHVNTHVGEELDVLFMWKLAKWSHVSAGFSYFFPRDYVRYAIIGHPDQAVWFFVQFLVKF